MSGWVSFDDTDADGPRLGGGSAPVAAAPQHNGGFASMFGAAPAQSAPAAVPPPSPAAGHYQHQSAASPAYTQQTYAGAPVATASNPFLTFGGAAASARVVPTAAPMPVLKQSTGSSSTTGSKSFQINPFADLLGSGAAPQAPQQLRAPMAAPLSSSAAVAAGHRPSPPIPPPRRHAPAPHTQAVAHPQPVLPPPAAAPHVIQTRSFDAFASVPQQPGPTTDPMSRDSSSKTGGVSVAPGPPAQATAGVRDGNGRGAAGWGASVLPAPAAASRSAPAQPSFDSLFSESPQALQPAVGWHAAAQPHTAAAGTAAPAHPVAAAPWPTFDTLFADASSDTVGSNQPAPAPVAQQTPQPPSYDAIFAPSETSKVSTAPVATAAAVPPPSYEELFGASSRTSTSTTPPTAGPPPPAYDDLFGAPPPAASLASSSSPPPPSYDSLFGSASAPHPDLAQPPAAAQSAGWAATVAAQPTPSAPPSYNSLFSSSSEPQHKHSVMAGGRPDTAPRGLPNATPRGVPAPARRLSGSAQASSQDPSAVLAQCAVGVPAVGGAGACAAGAEARDALCIELRLASMRGAPKSSLAPRLLASAGGSLFLAPGGAEGVAALQWADAAHAPCVPRGLPRAEFEDSDAAPSGALRVPDSHSSEVSAILTHEPSGMLWTAHHDRRICRWSLQPGSGSGFGAVLEQQWPAARVGVVKAMAITPWGDLWSGSENGSMRVWAYPSGNPGRRAPSRIRELKRSQHGKPYDKVHAMAVSSTGNTVWSLGRQAGRTSVLIWHAHSMQCLGSVPAVGMVLLAAAGLDTDSDVPWVDPHKGLDPRLLARSVAARPLQPESAELLQGEAGDPAATLGLMAHKGAAKVSKLAAKFGRKVHTSANAAFSQVPVPAGYIPPGGASSTVQNALPSTPSAPGGSSLSEAASSLGGGRAKVKTMVATLAGGFILSHKHGLVQQYTETGRLEWAIDMRCTVSCLCVVGTAVWCGCVDGRLRVIVPTGGASVECVRNWQAHLFPLLSLTLVGGTVYSLASDGTVRGWPAIQPPPPLQAAWRDAVRASLRPHKVRVVTGTWNVNETRPRPQALSDWLAHLASASGPGAADLVCLALQEVEIGTTSVAWDAAISVLNKGLQEKGTANAQWWTSGLLSALGGVQHWERVALRQMSGVLLLVFARKALMPDIGEVSTGSVACGVMGVAGNKGGVAIQLSLFRRRIVVLSSHFAAHQEKVDERNADFAKIARNMRFRHQQAPAIATAATHTDVEDDGKADTGPLAREGSNLEQDISVTGGMSFATYGEGMRDAELLVWAGDFNYRINQRYNIVVDHANRGISAQLLPLDQLRQEAAKGNIFHGLYEVPPTFPPTYKYDKGVPTVRGRPLPYDSSEKMRVPAWTDRILWRGSVPSVGPGMAPGSGVGREDDVVAVPFGDDPYTACMEICDSDHKPVLLDLDVRIPGYIQEMKRRITLDLLAAAQQQEQQQRGAAAGGETAVAVQVHVQDPHVLTALPQSLGISGQVPLVQVDVGGQVQVHVLNLGTYTLVLRAAGLSATSPWLPSWLEAKPACFILEPGQARAVKLGAVRPDIMQAGAYPLAATVQFLPQPLCAHHVGAQQRSGSPAIVCVEVR